MKMEYDRSTQEVGRSESQEIEERSAFAALKSPCLYSQILHLGLQVCEYDCFKQI